jgi:hypothetical protein
MQSAQLLSPLLFKNPVTEKKRIAITLAISRLLWLAVIPALFLQGEWRLPVLLGIVLMSGLLTMVSSPAWLSWMAEIVPVNL